jgi:hypothetical protein
MKNTDLDAGLRSLKNILKEIKALLAWEQLKQQEARPGQPPGFILDDPADQNIKNQYSSFLTTSLKMHGILNDATNNRISQAKRQYYKQQLLKIENQVRTLNLRERFIKL